jgi:proteasome accessory factor C
MSRITASDRLQRLLALVPWVAAHDGPTVSEVCARFELEPRELLDELTLVSMVGLPPYTPDELFDMVVEDDRVWVHLSPSFTRSLRLTPAQALALVASGASLRSVPGSDPEGPLARGLDKLAAVLGAEPEEVVDVDLGRASGATLALLDRAIAQRTTVRLDYYTFGRDQRTTRDVDPARVFADQGGWYLVAHDHLRGDERVFRVDRIVGAELLDRTFEAAPDGTGGLALFQPDGTEPRVVVEVDHDGAWVVDAYPVESVEWAGPGRQRLTLVVTARPWLERLLLRLGPHGRVVDDGHGAEWSDAGREAARRVLDRYRSGGKRAIPSTLRG